MNPLPDSSSPVVPSQPFTVTLKMLSDWHIGSGAGRPGDVDRLVQRDRDQLPYVPAKTLTGIWRDACELVAQGLDNGEDDKSNGWGKWVDYLFGDQPALSNRLLEKAEVSPRPAALSVRAAYFSEAMKKGLCQNAVLQNTITFVKPGISIEAESGCAKEDFLRFEEMVRGGAVLQASCELNWIEPKLTDDQKRTAYALLVAGAKLVERLGGKRRRGAGNCTLTLEEDISTWVKWIEQHLEPPEPPEAWGLQAQNKSQDQSQQQSIDPKSNNQKWEKFTLTLEAKSALLISNRTIGNVVETLDYIPGAHLLRLVVRKLKHLGVDFGGAIAKADLLVTHATIAIPKQATPEQPSIIQPTQPIPLALFYKKVDGGLDKGQSVYNRLAEEEPNGIQLKGYRSGYIEHSDETQLPKHFKATTIVATHNTIQDEVQRPTSEVGGVYSYEAIAPGTYFQSELRMRKSLADKLAKEKEDWWKSLEGSDRIGQSKKDDYGSVTLSVCPVTKVNDAVTSYSESLTVWLLSDVLLRDQRLRPTTHLTDLRDELQKQLNQDQLPEYQVTLGDVKEDSKTLSAIARHHRTDSWQVRWRLPRPSLVGLAAGSCIKFPIKKGTLHPDRMAELQIQGIGERRAEGYGQIRLNSPLLLMATSNLKQAPIPEATTPDEGSSKPIPEGNDLTYAQVIEKEAWREAIRRACLFLASNEKSRRKILGLQIEEENGQKKSIPSMSQLGALRSVLSKLQSPDDNAVMTWLDKRKDKWPKESLDLIQTQIKEYDQVWTHLTKALEDLNYPRFTKLTLTLSAESTLKNKLWAEAVRTFVDACIRAHKREIEDK